MADYNSILKILKRGTVSTFFQPVVDAKECRILGHEALSRGPLLSGLRTPAQLAKSAAKFDAQTELELLCIQIALGNFKSMRSKGLLFVNVAYETLINYDTFKAAIIPTIAEYGINPRHIVFELTEHSPNQNIAQLQQSIDKLHCLGFSIALDDLGAGYSSLQLWSELDLDYVKFDRHFIHNIENDAVKQRFVHLLNDLALSQDCHVIAEGVQTPGEAQWLADIGVRLMQGFYFSRPRRNLAYCTVSHFPKYFHYRDAIPKPIPKSLSVERSSFVSE